MEYAKGAAHPASNLGAVTLDLETVGFAEGLSEIIDVGTGLKEAIIAGDFVQTYPEPIDVAEEALPAKIPNCRVSSSPQAIRPAAPVFPCILKFYPANLSAMLNR